MKRDRRWYEDARHFLTGVFVGLMFVAGLMVVAPAFAAPMELPAVGDDMRLYLLIGSGVLLFAALVMRLLRRRDEADDAALDGHSDYGMRFFRTDRPIALE